MTGVKEVLSVLAVVLAFVGYLPYYRDVLRHKTHPHVYSWWLWTLLTALIVALQVKGGAGSAVWVTVSVGLLAGGVAVLSLRDGKKDITLSDSIVAILSLIAIGFWLIVDQPEISIILAVAADMLAFVPTVRKSWNKPYSETLEMYLITTLRFVFVVLAIESYSLLSALWPAAWLLGNGIFSILLIVRRHQLGMSANENATVVNQR